MSDTDRLADAINALADQQRNANYIAWKALKVNALFANDRRDAEFEVSIGYRSQDGER